MKPLVFNKESWHYWLATEMGSFNKYRSDSNICEYTRTVLKGVVIACGVAAILLALTYWILITLVWWAVVIQYGFIWETGPMALSIVIILVGMVVGVTNGIPWLYRRARRAVFERLSVGDHKKVKTDTFITKAYRSWKDKTCVRVTLIGDTESD